MMRAFIALLALLPWVAGAAPLLDIAGYADRDGAITIQHAGDTVDPYFALQALLLAHEHGLDIAAPAAAWRRWLLPRQKPDATFDRFCRRGPVWGPCKTADADDALLALWIRFLDATAGRDADAKRSRAASAAALARLRDPARGIYLVSPVYQHGLFIDNLEVWHATGRDPALARAIQKAFAERDSPRYLVSTQPEQAQAQARFYPDAVAQIFPLLVDFPAALARGQRYAEWMRAHRGEWLEQVRGDFAWGLVALVALRRGDRHAAGCWIREAAPHRHGAHWTITDEVALQVLQARRVAAVGQAEACT